MSHAAEPTVGDVLQGRVTKIAPCGVFIALPGGFKGLLHKSQISWLKRKTRPCEFFAIGDQVTVIVREFARSKKRGMLLISLGYRELQPNPWELVEVKYPPGTRTQGRIIEFLPFGAIIEFDDGFPGLLHDSELSWTKARAKASELFKIGDLVPVVIQQSDKAKAKLHLSYRETLPNPWDSVTKDLPVGGKTRGRIVKCVEYGYFVELDNGCQGLWHKSSIPERFVAEVGSVLEFVVTFVDPLLQRISLCLPTCGSTRAPVGALNNIREQGK
ncbi:MAG TPA: S1 RNA-binding domain-containing protein [Planctomycetota bacterium]